MSFKLWTDLTTTLRTDRRASANRRLAKVAVQYTADTFVVNQH